MKPNPIVEEVWRIKDELAREASYDLHRMCENLRRWEAEHPPPEGVIRSAEELRKWFVEEENKRNKNPALTLKEQPPPQKNSP
jgi:hypothetical protein